MKLEICPNLGRVHCTTYLPSKFLIPTYQDSKLQFILGTGTLPGKRQLHHDCIECSEQTWFEEALDLQLHPATPECALLQGAVSHSYTHRSYQQPPKQQQQQTTSQTSISIVSKLIISELQRVHLNTRFKRKTTNKIVPCLGTA